MNLQKSIQTLTTEDSAKTITLNVLKFFLPVDVKMAVCSELESRTLQTTGIHQSKARYSLS